MDDQLNVPLEDAELLAEVELTTNLIIAASGSERAMSETEIDEILGLPLPVPVETNGSSRIPYQPRRG